ncbi:MAG: hypothetical protein O3C28_08440 [Proteobacteria bacterium]|nr:hypothetical protein [Pseudomonadota bacterium]
MSHIAGASGYETQKSPATRLAPQALKNYPPHESTVPFVNLTLAMLYQFGVIEYKAVVCDFDIARKNFWVSGNTVFRRYGKSV